MKTSRAIALSLVLVVTALAPAAALAGNGADDAPDAADDNGGLRDSSSRDDDGGNSRNGVARRGDRAKRVTGRCTGRATAKIKAKHDDGRIETEFEVDQNRNGVAWKVTIRRNGVRVASTTATTRAPSGSFSVERRIANAAGPDRITARATSRSGQVCSASVTV
ncbi:MAG: hypothetical protein ACLGI5_08755 [Thermoleophilia bacterium]